MADIKHGLSVLKKNIKIAPEKPGVYRMLGEGDKVLYVGKAKNIKKRIVAYSNIDKLPVRLQRMVSEIRTSIFPRRISALSLPLQTAMQGLRSIRLRWLS